MHCLNLKVVTDFSALSFPGRISSSVRGDSLRVNRIVACSVPGSGSGSGPVQGPSQGSVFSRSETYALLKHQLEVAAKSEVLFAYSFDLCLVLREIFAFLFQVECAVCDVQCAESDVCGAYLCVFGVLSVTLDCAIQL